MNFQSTSLRRWLIWFGVLSFALGGLLSYHWRASQQREDDPTLDFLHGHAGIPDHDWTVHIKRVGSFGIQTFTMASGRPLTCVVIGTNFYDLPHQFRLYLALGGGVALLVLGSWLYASR